MENFMAIVRRKVPGMDQLEQCSDLSQEERNRRTEQNKADAFNAMAGDSKGFECEACRGKGDIAYLSEYGKMTVRDCKCKKARVCLEKMERSGLKNIIRDYTFDKFNAVEPWQKIILEGAKQYAEKPEGWFMICGQSGCGKTHLSTAICREFLLRGANVQFMPWRDEIAKIKAASMDGDGREKLMTALKTGELLYIDDLFKTGRSADGSMNPTSSDGSNAFEILNYRYNNRLPTIISTESTPDELVAFDEALGGRIVELCGPNAYIVSRDPKRNYRMRNVVKL